MNRIHSNLEVKDFNPAPAEVVKRSVCMDSGKVPGVNCSHDPRGSRIVTEYFAKGTEPSSSEVCDVHILAKVDINSKDLYGRPLLANPFCPPESVQERVFIKRPEPFLPKDPSNKSLATQIKDWMYELTQGEYCTIHSEATAPPTNSTPTQPTTGGNLDPGTENPEDLPPEDIPEDQPDDGIDVIP
jgi:penicillin-binding protein 1A